MRTKITDTPNKSILRYSDEELSEFYDLVCVKLSICEAKVLELETSLQEHSEDNRYQYGGDLMDVSNRQDEKEILLRLLDRQKKYRQQLNNALFRIQNKTYGICSVSGKKISKERLRIVPTTTKSVEAKNDETRWL